MSRKHYRMIATALRDALLINMSSQDFLAGAKAAHASAAVRVANALAADNAKFDRAKFLTACGV